MIWEAAPTGMQTERIRGLDSDVDNHGPGKREVDLYVRTYTTLLQSSGAISVASLEPAHITAASSLHAGALEPEPDLNAFIYSVQRLPASIVDVRHDRPRSAAAGLRPRRLRRNVGLAGPERARPPPPLALRWHRDAGGLHRLLLRSRRPDPHDRRLPDRVEQDAPHHPRRRPPR